MVAMLTCGVLLRHFRKKDVSWRDRRLRTLIPYVHLVMAVGT